MSPKDRRLSKLHKILESGPSAETWASLCKWTERCKSEEWAQTVEPFLVEHLEKHWSERLRTFPRRWLNQLKDGNAPPGISLVARLEWQGSVSEAKLEQWFGRDRFPSLRALSFENKSISRKALRKLMAMPAFENVEEFALGSANFGAAGLQELFASPFFGRLQSLSIATALFKERDKLRLDPDIKTDSLERLDLSSTDMQQAHWEALKAAEIWTNVESLTLGSVYHPVKYFAPTDGDWAPSLRSLNLVAQSAEALKASQLAASPLAQRLTHLTLSVTKAPMGRPTLRLLEKLPALESLTLRWDDFSDVSQLRLEEWEHPTLRHLNLRFVKLPRSKQEALVRSPLLRQLNSLAWGLAGKEKKLPGWENLIEENGALVVS